MENYYFLEGDHRRGPFSLDQLKTYPISLETPIWKDGRDEWVPAGDLEELKGAVEAEPVVRQFFLFRRGRRLRMPSLGLRRPKGGDAA